MKKIYKYFRGDENTLDSLRNDYFWFSKPQFFNDPFDSNMDLINHYEHFLNTMEDRFKSCDPKDIIINGARNFGICCFSKQNNNQHMWGHYGDSHKGICIEYNCSGFDDYFSDKLKAKCVLQDIDYREELIDLNEKIEWEKTTDGDTISSQINEIVTDSKLLDTLFEKLLFQKNKRIWKNEEESRLIIGGLARQNIINKECDPGNKECENGYKIPIKRNMITAVIFGVGTDKVLKEQIKDVFGGTITYKQSRLDFRTWELIVE